MSEERQASVTRKWTFPQPQTAALTHLDASPSFFALSGGIDADVEANLAHLAATPTFFALSGEVDQTIYANLSHLDASPTFFGLSGEVLQPVDLTLSGGSIRFPENNNETALEGYRGFLSQPSASMPLALNSDGAFFCVMRLPLDRLHDNRRYRVAGTANFTSGRTFSLCFYGSDYQVSGSRFRLNGSVKGSSGNQVDINSAPVDETDVLMVFSRDGDNFAVDWYSLADGTKHAGSPTTDATCIGMDGWRSEPFLIGGGDLNATQVNIARPHGYFTGEISALGYVSGSVSDATWQSIALGADIVVTLGAGNVGYLREFDGTSATLGAPSAATSDGTSDAVVVDDVEVGSFIRRQDFSNFLTIDYLPTGRVFALVGGASSASLPLSGLAGGSFTGNVEARIVYEGTGNVLRNWTEVGTISGGSWSGSLSVPRSSNGWFIIQVRLQGSTEPDCEMRERVAAGFKFGVLAQSQGQIALTEKDRGDAVSTANLMRISASVERERQQVDKKEKLFRVGPHPSSDALVAFVEQWAQYGDNTPVEIVSFAESSTSAIALIDDSDSNRDWSDLAEIVDYVGSDFTAIIWQWGTNDAALDFENVFDAVLLGTGPLAGDHYLSDGIFDAGFAMVLSPLSRHSTTVSGPFDSDQGLIYGSARDGQLAYARANGWPIGPYLNDLQIVSSGGPHQDESADKGNPLFGARLAVAAARQAGLDFSANPVVAAAVLQNSNTDLLISFTLPNGGSLQTDGGDSAITGFEVSDDTGSTWSRSGFTAARNGDTVVLTKASGSWTGGGSTLVRYNFGGPLMYGTAGPSEATLLAGQLYESYALDVLGLGLPVAATETPFVAS